MPESLNQHSISIAGVISLRHQNSRFLKIQFSLDEKTSTIYWEPERKEKKNLITASSIFKLTSLETGAVPEKVVYFARFDIFRKAGDEEGLNLVAGVIDGWGWYHVVMIERVVRHF